MRDAPCFYRSIFGKCCPERYDSPVCSFRLLLISLAKPDKRRIKTAFNINFD